MDLLLLIRALRASGFSVEAEELADVIWLANQLPSLSEKRKTKDEVPEDILTKTTDIHGGDTQKTSNVIQNTSKISKKNEVRAGVYLPFESSNAFSGLPSKVGGVSALPHKLALGRALRPLLRQVPSRHNYEIDEDATVQRIADTQVWLPVMHPSPARWLELDVVIDEWPSLVLWREGISELITLLTNLGIFKSIQVWSLWTSKDGKKVELRNGWGSKAEKGTNRTLKELVSIQRNHLIMVLSDTISPAWYNGSIGQILDRWVRSEIVTLFHLLPYQFWNHTGLVNTIPIYLQFKNPGLPNSKLISMPRPGDNESLPKSGFLSLPTLPFDPALIASWAHSIAGRNNNWIPGVMLPLDNKREQFRQSQIQVEKDLNASNVKPDESSAALVAVKRFKQNATPEAWKIAGYLSATTPLSLPLMRLVQQVMLPESSREHLAEFYLSSLIQREKSLGLFNDEGARYEFAPGIRRILLSSISRQEAVEVLRQTSRFISRETGKVIEFNALLADPSLVSQIVPAARPFAEISQSTLRSLGGEYASLAESLKRHLIDNEISVENDISTVQPETPVQSKDSLRAADKFIEAQVRLKKKSQKEIPTLLPYLVGRKAQEDSLREAVKNNRQDLPQIFIIHGDDRQAFDMFIARVANAILPNLLQISSSSNFLQRIPLIWPNIQKIVDFRNRYQQSLGEQVLYDSNASVEDIQKTLASYPGPVVIESELLTDDFAKHGDVLLDTYLSFWEEWPTLESKQRLLVFLVIIYKSGNNSRSFFGLPRSPNSRIEKLLNNLNSFTYSRISVTVLPKLENISETEALDWARSKALDYYNGDITTLIEKIRVLYEKEETIPMESLAFKLKEILTSTSGN